ncbi:MAG: SGNH/GDSL hydrolase family protein, partial [Actinobacteria bacterium]|nr:SGNH/GDSL hydrolase family protein [Actinomycetota bacterium]
LVDIGGWWLNQSLDKAIKDVETLRWFQKNFEAEGRISPPDFASNLSKIVHLLRERIGAEPIVLNTLVVEPGSPHHNYQLLAPDHFTRTREFNIALTEVSRALGFHILDVDRVLKQGGIRDQLDFAHVPVEAKMPIAREAFRILRELEIV